jgi:hypothetical protein
VLQYKLGTGPIGLAEGMGEGRFTTMWLSKDLATGQQVVLKVRGGLLQIIAAGRLHSNSTLLVSTSHAPNKEWEEQGVFPTALQRFLPYLLSLLCAQQ